MKGQKHPIRIELSVPLVLACASLLVFALNGATAPFLNLGFELGMRGRPYAWAVRGSGFEFTLDTNVHQSGSQSFRIENVNAPRGVLATASQTFPVKLVRGKRVHVSGWIRTANARDGAAALWWRVDGSNGTLSLDNSPLPGPPPGNCEWTRYEFDRDVSPAATSVSWGVFFRGSGTAWFDTVEITIDGIPVPQKRPPFIGQPIDESNREQDTGAEGPRGRGNSLAFSLCSFAPLPLLVVTVLCEPQ
jgi:hypothetical protein